MDRELLSRIEDQAIEKFNDKFRNISKDNMNQARMFEIMVEWADFWIDERPISKVHNYAVECKQQVCDLRLSFILHQARRWKLDEALKSHFKHRYEFAT